MLVVMVVWHAEGPERVCHTKFSSLCLQAHASSPALFVCPVCCFLQIQLALPGGYSRNGPTTRNFTFHACLSPASRQQVGEGAGWVPDAGLAACSAGLPCRKVPFCSL